MSESVITVSAESLGKTSQAPKIRNLAKPAPGTPVMLEIRSAETRKIEPSRKVRFSSQKPKNPEEQHLQAENRRLIAELKQLERRLAAVATQNGGEKKPGAKQAAVVGLGLRTGTSIKQRTDFEKQAQELQAYDWKVKEAARKVVEMDRLQKAEEMKRRRAIRDKILSHSLRSPSKSIGIERSVENRIPVTNKLSQSVDRKPISHEDPPFREKSHSPQKSFRRSLPPQPVTLAETSPLKSQPRIRNLDTQQPPKPLKVSTTNSAYDMIELQAPINESIPVKSKHKNAEEKEKSILRPNGLFSHRESQPRRPQNVPPKARSLASIGESAHSINDQRVPDDQRVLLDEVLSRLDDFNRLEGVINDRVQRALKSKNQGKHVGIYSSDPVAPTVSQVVDSDKLVTSFEKKRSTDLEKQVPRPRVVIDTPITIVADAFRQPITHRNPSPTKQTDVRIFCDQDGRRYRHLTDSVRDGMLRGRHRQRRYLAAATDTLHALALRLISELDQVPTKPQGLIVDSDEECPADLADYKDDSWKNGPWHRTMDRLTADILDELIQEISTETGKIADQFVENLFEMEFQPALPEQETN